MEALGDMTAAERDAFAATLAHLTEAERKELLEAFSNMTDEERAEFIAHSEPLDDVDDLGIKVHELSWYQKGALFTQGQHVQVIKDTKEQQHPETNLKLGTIDRFRFPIFVNNLKALRKWCEFDFSGLKVKKNVPIRSSIF